MPLRYPSMAVEALKSASTAAYTRAHSAAGTVTLSRTRQLGSRSSMTASLASVAVAVAGAALAPAAVLAWPATRTVRGRRGAAALGAGRGGSPGAACWGEEEEEGSALSDSSSDGLGARTRQVLLLSPSCRHALRWR